MIHVLSPIDPYMFVVCRCLGQQLTNELSSIWDSCNIARLLEGKEIEFPGKPAIKLRVRESVK